MNRRKRRERSADSPSLLPPFPPVQDSSHVPTLPGLQFFEHSQMLLGILAVNLDLPLCVFLLDASETNYSGFRGAIDQARQRWREIQSWMMGSFHGPVYEWVGSASWACHRLRAPRGRGACRLPGF